jgi:class 3 adenylate cyclase
MSDPALAAASRVLLSLSPGAYFINPNATLLMGLKIVTLSIRNGNSPSSAGGYVLYGLASTAILGNIRVGYAFGELAVTLARRFDNLAVRARVLLIHAGFVAIWRRPFTECLTLLHEAHSTAIAAGDFTYANYAHLQTLFLGIVRSIPLPEYIEECVRMRAFVIRTRDPFAIDNLANWLQSARALQGDTRALAELHSVEFDETAAEQRYRNGSNLTTLGYYLIRKLHLAFLIGDIAAAFRFGNEAERFFGLLPGQVLLAEHALYFGLTLVEMRRVRFAPATLLRLARCRKRLRHWATHAPENYRPMYLLLDAESETLKGMASRALPMFDAAIDSAREGGFHNIEALSAERAARFCLRVEQSHAASAYFDEAIKAYRTWGATAKVQQLEDLVASLAGRSSALVSDPTQTVALEEETRVLRSRQRPDDSTSLTSVLQRLIADVLASRDLLRVAVVLRERGIPVVRAAGDRSAISTMREDLEESSRISPAVVTYVLRANEEVVLTSASLEEWFAACPHLRVRRPISILCFPIGSGKQPFGALYAEAGPLVGRGNVTAGQLRIICAAVASKIERARIEESLRHSRQLLHDTARAADSATRVRSHLEKFVPAPVRRLILKNLDAPELQPTDREISVMFIDVEGYTKLSEELDPLVLGKAIERYFSRYLEEIQRHGGAVNQIAGDGLMALFEEPKLHAQQAVNTALAVQRATDEIASAVGADAVPRLRPHIGINSGTVRVGATRMETAASALWTYTAVGPAVNLASRIAGAARGGEILIGRATADLLGGAFELEHLGPQNFKNVQGTTEIARVLDTAYPP